MTRGSVDVARSRIVVRTTAVEVHGRVTLGHEPKTKRSQRTAPVARSIMRRIEQHLVNHVGSEADALVFTAAMGGPRSARPSPVTSGILRLTERDWLADVPPRSGTALSPSWWPPAATSERSRSGPGTTVSPPPRPATETCSKTVQPKPFGRLEALLGGGDLPPGRQGLDG